MRFIGFCLLLCGATHALALTVIDDTGTQVTFNAPPQRIISLDSNLTELAYSAGLGRLLVAVSAYSDYPEEAQKLPQVGDAFHLDWQKVAELRPDLVLAWGAAVSAIDRAELNNMRLNLLVLEPKRLDDIPRELRLLGRIANTEAASEAAALDFEKHRRILRSKYASRSSLLVYFQTAVSPLQTVNGKHIISDILRLCKAKNVFSDDLLLAPSISTEVLINAKPQVMLGMTATHAEQEETTLLWRNMPLNAVRQGHIGFIHPDLISRFSPRILQGAQEICEQIDAMRDTPGVFAAQSQPSSLHQLMGALCCARLPWQLPDVTDARNGNPASSCTIWPSPFYQLPVPY